MNHSPRSLPPMVHALILGSIALLTWAYWPAWLQLFETWNSDPDYNHGFLVIPVSLWLLWHRRDRLPSIRIQPSWWGLGLLSLAGFIRWVGAEFFFSQFDPWSIPIWIAGTVLLFGGWQLLRWSAGAIAFLWFMAPLPGTLTDTITLPLQQVSALLSTWTLQLFGQPALRLGTTINIGEQTLDVERACSGLRICYGTLAVAVAYIILVRPGRILSGILVAASIPVAVVANASRVSMTGLLYGVVSGDKAHQYVHDFAGMVMLPLALLQLWLVHLIVSRVITAFSESTRRGSILLWKSLAVAGAVGALLVFWQERQARAAVITLLDMASGCEAEAQRLLNEGKIDEGLTELGRAAGILDYYLRLSPDDGEAAGRLASVAAKLAFSPDGHARAARLSRKAWDRNRGSVEFGFQSIRHSLEANLPRDAIADAVRLMADDSLSEPRRREAFRLKRTALIADARNAYAESTKWDQVLEELRSAVANDVEAVECAWQAAIICATQSVPGKSADEARAEADRLLADLVNKHPGDPLAWLVRARYRQIIRQHNSEPVPGATVIPEAAPEVIPGQDDTPAFRSPDADSDLDQAIQLADERAEARFQPLWEVAANRAVQRNEIEAARHFYTLARESDRTRFRPWLQLARLETGMNGQLVPATQISSEQRRTAIRILKEAIEINELKQEYLLRLELIAQQLLSGEQAEVVEAQASSRELRSDLEMASPEIAAAMTLYIGLVESSAAAHQGDLASAAKQLESSLNSDQVRSLSAAGGLLSGAWLTLANYYQRLGDAQQSQAAFQKASELESGTVPSKIAEAHLLEVTGELDHAAEVWKELTNRAGSSWQERVAAARSGLDRASAGMPVDIDWVKEQILRASEDGAPRSEVAALQADVLRIQGNTVQAISILEDALEARSLSARGLAQLITLYQAAGRESDADRTLPLLSELDSIAGLLAHVDLLVARGDVETARGMLGDAFKAAVSAQDSSRFALRRAELELADQNIDEARAALVQLVEKHPEHIEALVRLAEFYWQGRQLVDLRQVEQRLRVVQGEEGFEWRELRARRLLELATQAGAPEAARPFVQESEALIAEISAAPADPAAVSVLKGRLARLERKPDESLAWFVEAWKQRRNSPALFAELVFAHITAGKQEDARRLLDQQENMVFESPAVFDLALQTQAAIVIRNLEKSESVARKWASEISDAASFHRLARVLTQIGFGPSEAARHRMVEVEESFRAALDSDGTDPQVWGEYLRFLKNVKQDPATIDEALGSLLSSETLPELDRVFVAAQFLTDSEQRGPASRFWHQTVAIARGHRNPEIRVRALTAAAEFFGAIDPSTAERLVREALALYGQDVTSLRLLARLKLADGSFEALQEAASIIEVVGSIQGQLADADRRILGRIMHLRATKYPDDADVAADLRAAELAYTQIARNDFDDVQLQLIRGEIGNPEVALSTLASRALSSDASTTTMQGFVEFWQDNFFGTETMAEQVETVLQRLEQLPGRESAAIELRLRPSQLTANESFSLVQSALHRVALRMSDSTTSARLLQAVFIRLVRRGQADLVLQLYRQPVSDFSTADYLTALAWCAVSRPGDREWEAAVSGELANVDQKVDSEIADRAAADYFFLRGEWSNAERLYERCLRRNPANVGVLNNLSLVVMEFHHDADRAMSLLQQAEAAAASDVESTSFLADTRAWILMESGKFDEALEILGARAESATADVTIFIHLAACLNALNRRDEAALHYATANHIGVSESSLSPMDLTLWRQIKTEFSTFAAPQASRRRIRAHRTEFIRCLALPGSEPLGVGNPRERFRPQQFPDGLT